MAPATVWTEHHAGLFEACGSLRPEVFDAMRMRLSRAGCHNPREQSHLLARHLDCDDVTSIWALLMWNTPASLPLRDGLARWIEQGMPIHTAAGQKREAA
jgi:hypothetical protein